MLPDYHIHNYLCKHAKGEVKDYFLSAKEKGFTEICFSDHAPDPDGYDLKHRMTIEQFPEYAEAVKELQNQDNITVLYGIEADYYKDCEIFLGSWLKEQNFDIVLGSIHYIQDWGFDNPAERTVWDSVDITKTWREYFELVKKLAQTRMYDVVTHLDLPKKFGHRPKDKDLKEMAQPALDEISKADMAIELNTSGLYKPVKEIFPSPLLLELAREREIPICFGSDAHQPKDVGQCFDKAIALAQQAGYTERISFRKRQKELVSL